MTVGHTPDSSRTPTSAPDAATLAELRASGWTSRSTKDELRQILPSRLRSGETAFPGIVGFGRDIAEGGRHLARHRVLVSLLALSLIAMWGIVAPEAVAIPYVLTHGFPPWLGGVLMAAPVAGAVAGLVVVGRWQPEVASSRMIGMALLMPVPLLVAAALPPTPRGLVAVLLLWFVSGALQAFVLPLQATFALVVPADMRGRVIGLAGAASMTASALTRPPAAARRARGSPVAV